MTTWVVIAAYNEETSISSVLTSLKAQLSNVVVVDDGSTDQTCEAARNAGAFVVRHPINRGQGAALQSGIKYALERGADAIVTFDADGQHRPEDAVRLSEALKEGACDVALGTRFLDERSDIPFFRRLVLGLAVAFTRASSGLRVTDTHNGLRAFSRSAAEKLDLRMDRMAHASEILDQIRAHKLRFVEVSVQVRYTQYSMKKGQSSFAAGRVLLEYLIGRILG